MGGQVTPAQVCWWSLGVTCAHCSAGFCSSRTLIPVPPSSQQAPLCQSQVPAWVLALGWSAQGGGTHGEQPGAVC